MASDHDEDEALDPERFLAAKSYIEGQWHEAMEKSREVMEILRSIHPDLSNALGGNGQEKCAEALTVVTSSYNALHELGYYVLGENGYQKYLDELALERVKKENP